MSMASVAELLAPIAPEHPAGSYLRYDPLYDKLKEARREDADLPQGDWQTSRKAADWPLVIRLASEALTSRTKDLQVAAWLAEALLRRDGIPGLHQGLQLLHELLQNFWDQIYPPIEDGDLELRAGPLEWVGLKLDVAVRMAPLNQAGHSLLDYQAARALPAREEAEQDESLAATRQRAADEGRVLPEEFEAAFLATPKAWYRELAAAVDGALEAIGTLAEFCDGQFRDVAPNFGPLRTALEDFRRVAAQLLARKLELEPDPIGGDAAIDTRGLAGGAPVDRPGSAPARSSAAAGPGGGDAASWVAAAAARLRQERPLDPAAYLLLRGFRWGELRAGGTRIDPRLLAAPGTAARTALKGLLLDGRWAELLEAGEELMAQPFGRGWLDLQRYVLTACDALGSDYAAVGGGIRSELRTLLADLPELLSLSLMDDSPTANQETRTWLRDQQLLPEGSDVGTADIPPAAGRRDVAEIAQDRVRTGDARGAIELLMSAATQERSARSRFLRRSQAANIMVGAGLEAVALPVLRELLEQVDAHRLDEWEAGGTIAEPLALLYRCAAAQESGDLDLQALYTRVCRLDPMQAIRLGSSSSPDE